MRYPIGIYLEGKYDFLVVANNIRLLNNRPIVVGGSMFTVRILVPESSGRHIKLVVESYNDLSVAMRVASIRAQAAGVLAIVLRGNQIMARYGLGENIIA
jgi:hypothetical protein